MIRVPLYKIYWALQRWLVPGLRYSQHLYEDVLREYGPPSERWLDFGCGHQLLPPWRLEHEKELVGQARFLVGLDYDQWSLTQHETIEHRLRGDFYGAVFVDAGNAFDHVDVDPAVGAGIGLKWRSPIGPLRIYLAHPLNKSDRNVRLHIQLGTDL